MFCVCLPQPRRNGRNLIGDNLQVQTSGWLVKELIVVLREQAHGSPAEAMETQASLVPPSSARAQP